MEKTKTTQRRFVASLVAVATVLLAAQAIAMHPNHPLGFRPERAYQASF